MKSKRKNIVLDGRKMNDRASAYDEIASKMALPDYFGRNLDALWDLLSVYDEADITLEHSAEMANSTGAYGCRILIVFYQAAEENARLTFTCK